MSDTPLTVQPAPAGQILEAPVAEVLIMEDRAQVLRRARVELRPGRLALRLGPCTPLLADRTLRCRVRSAGADDAPAKVLDWRVTRAYVVRAARPEREQELVQALEGLVAEYLQENQRAAVRLHERGRVAQAVRDLARHVGERVVIGPFEPAWAEELEAAFGRRGELEEELLDLQWAQDDRRARVERLVQERRAALTPVSDYRAEVGLEAVIERAGTYLVEVEYQAPCALWRPTYTAELAPDGAGLAWASAGMVWQLTGEDWTGVELAFSTARPSLGAELPLLEDDWLSTREKTEVERKVVEVASRDQVIATTASAPQGRSSDTPPGLDDGGEARLFRVPGRVDVPSDGRPHRLEFERWQAPTECEYVCLPEKAEFVFLRSLQTYPGAQPLLAGPVALMRDGGYTGRGRIRFVAPGERFGLSWGSEDGLPVHREQHQEFEETGLRKRRQHDFRVELYLANQSGAPRRVRVSERVPVAELEAVEVEILAKETSPGYSRDAQGLVTWALELKPGADARLKLAYRVSMPSQVIWRG
ncbi:MAG TPA: DUF4139 domain-containing protein [Myxococcota bacterium]|nr:DUF4139 domain-containing protein [Myxococcota bacterium]HRY95085.1 DUF4139 domain-containing protein [Myxococcota bacterium]HSA22554.1 DUF4139 domain-containing protein [Myxococcota bacterium]